MRLIGIGGAHIDRRGQVSGDYVPAASNPGSMHEDVGGGALNALRNAVQRGVTATLISIRGGDIAGEIVARTTAEARIRDLSAIFLDRATPSYTALLDRHGELITGFADMGLYDLAFPKQLRRSAVREAIAANDAVLCDANVPASGLGRIADLAGARPLFAIGVSPAKVTRLTSIMPRIACLFTNRKEAASLTGSPNLSPADTARELQAQGLRAGIITAGREPLTGFDADGFFSLVPPQPRQVVDVTGAGDALAGATIAAMMSGKPLREAVREGMAASLLAIESKFAVATLSTDLFAERLALVPRAKTIT